ncbi:MAG: NAD(+)/NADH kinase [Myxococcota bacterium]
MIVHDARNPVAVRNAEALRAGLHRADLDESDLSDLTVVIGGDGFLLHTINERGLDPIYLGLNAGRVGFLLNDVEDWTATAKALKDRAWRPATFPMLRAECESVTGETITADAVNDLYLERASGQTARLGLTVDGSKVVETLVSDGIIISTALGSTAYNFSAGGPACHPSLRILAVTPICPHLPRLPPFAIPEDSHIEVEVQAPERRPVRAVADGRHVAQVHRVRVSVGPRSLRLAYLPGHDLTARMIKKILHP